MPIDPAPIELTLSPARLLGGLLALARVTGTLAFVAIPGLQAAPEAARIVLALSLTVMLAPAWPSFSGDLTAANAALHIAVEFAYGLLISTGIVLLLETFQLAAQIVGLQAGYSFASTVDPTTQADSTVLQTFLQLFSAFLFFGTGVDREIIRLLAGSPSGGFPPGAETATALVLRLGSQFFISGVRLALPVIGVLILMDLSFGVLSKVHPQFQVMSLSFPAKMLAALALLAGVLGAYPQYAQRISEQTLQAIARALGI